MKKSNLETYEKKITIGVKLSFPYDSPLGIMKNKIIAKIVIGIVNQGIERMGLNLSIQ